MTTSKRQRVALYMRVSTKSQTNLNQFKALRKMAIALDWDIVGVFWDRKSGKKETKRPSYNKMLKLIRSRTIDMVAVWSLSRAGRSTGELIDLLDNELRPNKVAFYSKTESIDTNTTSGRMLFKILAALAEFERELTVERVLSGLERARAEGKQLGKPRIETPGSKNYDPGLVSAVLSKNAQGEGVKKIAKHTKRSIHVVRRILRENNAPTNFNKQLKYGPEITLQVYRLDAEGRTIEEIVAETGCSPTTVRRILKKYSLDQTQRATNGLA